MLIRSCRTRWRFRAALRQVENDLPFRTHLRGWRQIALSLGFEFFPAKPLGNSRLRGVYQGLATEIFQYFDEIRTMTVLSVTLPASPAPGMLERVLDRKYMHEQTQQILTECAAAGEPDTGISALRETFQAHLAELHLSAKNLSCHARYVTDSGRYVPLLAAMSAVVRRMT